MRKNKKMGKFNSVCFIKNYGHLLKIGQFINLCKFNGIFINYKIEGKYIIIFANNENLFEHFYNFCAK